MNVTQQIENYIAGQADTKRDEMWELHRLILQVAPKCRLWFLDGRDASGKIVSNPNIGYGCQITNYANGKTREFYQIGLSANTSGISIYIMGLADKQYLSRTYTETIGKASVTGYCIKFKTLKNLNMHVVEALIRFAFEGPPQPML